MSQQMGQSSDQLLFPPAPEETPANEKIIPLTPSEKLRYVVTDDDTPENDVRQRVVHKRQGLFELAYKAVKHVKPGVYELAALAIIGFACGLRIFLAALGWPPSNSDEGTMGIMALHIAYRGEHPVFFYGYSYMGSIEAHLGAFFIYLFGPSLFALRLGVILLATLFFICMYFLTSMLYSKKLAVVTLVLLSLGSIKTIEREVIATGGSTQTLLFGSFAFLLATWLSLTYLRHTTMRAKCWRFAAYGMWGLAIGLGLWSDLVVLPLFAVAILLLVLFCWHEMIVWAWPVILLGVIIGVFPALYYNFNATHGADTVSTLLGFFHGSSSAVHFLQDTIKGIQGTALISVPTAIGNPFCPVMELSFLSDTSPHTPVCTVIHATWGVSYLTMLAVAIGLAALGLWRARSRPDVTLGNPDKHRLLVRSTARLLLLGGAALAICVYAVSSAPVDWPGVHARYLVTLLVALPAVIAPLWQAASTVRQHLTGRARIKAYASRTMLALYALFLVIGTLILFSEVPAAQTFDQQDHALINNLVRIHATHIYTDYWTCNRLAFVSDEQVICGVFDNNLQPTHNRDLRYLAIVSADPHSAYVFLITQVPPLLLRQAGSYRRYIFGEYVVYQPVGD